MKMLRALAAVLLLSATLPASEEGVLKGVVKDTPHGVPIPSAYILVHRSFPQSNDIRVTPERDGTFRVNLAPGIYDVFVTGVSFAPACTKLEIRAGEVTVYNPRLRPSRVGGTD